MTLTPRQKELLSIVKQSHGDQLRKYTDEPYWTHPYAVAQLVFPFDDGTNFLIEIALLHDVIEDTDVRPDQLQNILLACGYLLEETNIIERGVMALTDVFTRENFDHMNRTQRKQFEAHRLKKIHPDFQTVKYADLIHNTESIVQYDKGFAKKYVQEKRYILNLMRNGNLDLFMQCYKTLLEAETELEII